MAAYKPLSRLYWFPKPTSLTFCLWQSSQLGPDTCNKSIWLMRSAHWLIRVLHGISWMTVERFARTGELLNQSIWCFLSFPCAVVFCNRILYIAVRLNLGQEHKRQAEAPNASRSNMHTKLIHTYTTTCWFSLCAQFIQWEAKWFKVKAWKKKWWEKCEYLIIFKAVCMRHTNAIHHNCNYIHGLISLCHTCFD